MKKSKETKQDKLFSNYNVSCILLLLALYAIAFILPSLTKLVETVLYWICFAIPLLVLAISMLRIKRDKYDARTGFVGITALLSFSAEALYKLSLGTGFIPYWMTSISPAILICIMLWTSYGIVNAHIVNEKPKNRLILHFTMIFSLVLIAFVLFFVKNDKNEMIYLVSCLGLFVLIIFVNYIERCIGGHFYETVFLQLFFSFMWTCLSKAEITSAYFPSLIKYVFVINAFIAMGLHAFRSETQEEQVC